MPSLIRFLVLVGVLAGIVYAGMWSVATFVQPQQREMSKTLPANALSGK
ncbi:MAG: histidine kinase [Methylobacteriaceae bacterium]|nr:histidine kinase [Methylobacteriaceae bacterium]